ncbi:class GN sortase [Shewanella psychrotolerans]|uniref:class GN sortase n=1 Tax=Shewanella psychrotolerans TaxID=2864206 RepID=UPI001C65B40C|nr:class GN sortase [Shewanella psychrotolerans]QYK03007.1 class GN sortase [Shewanella psychrotolerans]
MKGLTSKVSGQRMVLVITVVACALLFKGGYMQAKAHFAQFLIEQAWNDTLSHGGLNKPWSWADTYPIAKMQFMNSQHSVMGDALYILAGASGRNLAFGPAAIMSNSQMNAWGNTVIAGHRDTHFARLKGIKPGQLISLQDSSSRERLYRVDTIAILAEDDTSLMGLHDELQLTLVTCYPFESLAAQSRWRFVVVAKPIKTEALADVAANASLDRHDAISP